MAVLGFRKFATLTAALVCMVALSGCEGSRENPGWENPYASDADAKRQTVFGEGGLTLFGGDKAGTKDQAGGIGVNSFLWRASLDTLSFMPISSADPFGGVILTDWHSPRETPNERFKLQVYILSRVLRADGVRVSVFRQVRVGDDWRDASVSDQTGTNMENAILLRARQMRRAVAQEQ